MMMTDVVRDRPACPLCGSEVSRPHATVDEVAIVRCGSCGLVRQADPSATVAYDAVYFSSPRVKGGYANYFRDADINRRTFAARLARIHARLGRRGRLLDVGCALGDFVLEASRQGWDAEGLEVSEFAAREARRRGARVHLGPLSAPALRGHGYDVVTLYDTLEHTADPVAMLREAARILRPGGIVHVVTPNVAGLQAVLFGRHWYHYKPAEHLVYFDPATLQRAIGAAGLAWRGWARTGSYVTVSYVLDRLRAYGRPFALLARAADSIGLGAIQFYLHVGEMEGWGRGAAD